MRIANRLIYLFAAFVAMLQLEAFVGAQEVEKHETEELTREELGPYRPQQLPDLRKTEQNIVAGANQFRAEQKLAPLVPNDKLNKAASAFAKFMAEKDLYGHHADDRSPAQRVRASEYDYCLVAENIAYQFRSTGFETADLGKQFLEGWKNSPPHRKNLLDADEMETGVAIEQSKTTGVFYAVQLFGRPKSAAIHFTIANLTASVVDYTIGEHKFSLPGRFTRRHTACRAEPIQLVASAEPEALKPAQQDPIKPTSGDAFLIDADGDQISIKPGTATKAE